jgi:hypothetical protein
VKAGGVIFQKMVFFITTAVRTSNPTTNAKFNGRRKIQGFIVG